MTADFAFETLSGADLVVDAVYRGRVDLGIGGDPVCALLPGSGNAGGFRARPKWAIATLR
jgi:hypothetical protein